MRPKIPIEVLSDKKMRGKMQNNPQPDSKHWKPPPLGGRIILSACFVFLFINVFSFYLASPLPNPCKDIDPATVVLSSLYATTSWSTCASGAFFAWLAFLHFYSRHKAMVLFTGIVFSLIALLRKGWRKKA